MKILFDHQTFSLQNYGGISRYHIELVKGINKSIVDEAIVSLLYSNNIHIHENELKISRILPKLNIRGKGKFTYYSNQLYSILKLKTTVYDVFHATYYDPYFLPYLNKHPFVITIHDMIYEKFSSEYPNLAIDTKIIRNKKLLAEKASRIIAVSENTKSDIVELMRIDPSKIQVINHGSSFLPMGKNLNLINGSYFLYVGNRNMYKNFQGLLFAIHNQLKKYNMKLICAGGGDLTVQERKDITALGLGMLVEQQPILDQSLQRLYENAYAFIFPTFYEGFGIPILEAFACDCPCIVSRTSSLPEVAGDAVLYIDPNIPESISVAIEQILTDSNLREILILKGRQQLTKFSWDRTVKETLELYESIF